MYSSPIYQAALRRIRRRAEIDDLMTEARRAAAVDAARAEPAIDPVQEARIRERAKWRDWDPAYKGGGR